MSKKIAVICNPVTENVKTTRVAENIKRVLEDRAIDYRLFTDNWPATLEGFTNAWIVGGDGTLNYFINTYPDTRLPLCTFKGGSGNDLHWLLYGDRGFEDQLEVALSDTVQEVDAGICNGKLFLNGVGIGFDGAIVQDLIGKRKMNGKASYLVSVVKQIVSYAEKQVKVQVNDESITENSFMITVANGKRYGGGFTVAPKASIVDGLLEIVIVGKIAPLKRIKYLPLIERGEHLDLPFLQYRQSGRITIQTEVEVPAHLDGEYYSSNNFEIECLPKRFLFSL